MSYNNDPQKKCGFCGETIPARSDRCPYCGSLLEVTFDNGYGSNEPNQPADQGMNPFPGEPAGTNNGRVSSQDSSRDNGRDSSQYNAQDSSRDNDRDSGTVDNPVNSDASNPAHSPESAGAPERTQTQPQEPAPAQYQTQPPAPAQTQTQPQQEIQAQYQTQQEIQAQYQTQQGGQGQWQNPERPEQDYRRPYYQNRPQQGQRYEKPALSNGLKVFLTLLFALLPGIGQLAGIITAIVFMNSEGDKDRRSFGVALLVACIIMFVLACIGCFILSIASASLPFKYNNF